MRPAEIVAWPQEDKFRAQPKGTMTVSAQASEVLAVHGGTPVRKTLLPYGRQSIDEDEFELSSRRCDPIG